MRKVMPVLFLALAFTIPAAFLFTPIGWAQNSTNQRVTKLTTQEITLHGVCISITDNCSGDLMIPDKTSAEFLGIPNFFGANSCASSFFCGAGDDPERAFSASFNTTCGIASNGSAYCWGASFQSPVGDGFTTTRSTPTVVSGGYRWRSISAGSAHTCGLLIDGTAMCWGRGTNGELGNGTTTALQLTPTAVSGGYKWKSITSGNGYSCGVQIDGTAMCWGRGSNGQLGDGLTTATQTTPIAVSGGHSWRYVVAGNYYHSCGLRMDGVVMCWGQGVNGELGDGLNTNSLTPVTVSGGHTWKSLSTPTQHVTCGIRTDDIGMCWGLGTTGQIGDGTNTKRPSPVTISGGYSWKAITTGGSHTCGIRTNNQAMCWGSKGDGQLGDGTTTPASSYTPLSVSGGHSWRAITAGQYHTCGVRIDGTALCWGQGQNGKLGDGLTSFHSVLSPGTVLGGYRW